MDIESDNSVKVTNSAVNFEVQGDLVKIDGKEFGPTARDLVSRVFGATGLTARQIRSEAQAHADAKLIDAKADAEAKLIQLRARIEANDIVRRACSQAQFEQVEQQQNLEDIVRHAIPLLTDGATPAAISSDWLGYYRSHARLSSDEEMKRLWARILAGEANNKGSFGKWTMNIVSAIDSGDAAAFAALAKFGWDEPHFARPIITNLAFDIFKQNGVTFDSIMHLQEIGLLTFSGVGEYHIQFDAAEPAREKFRYRDRSFVVTAAERTIDLGKVTLSKAGSELARICEPTIISGYADAIVQHWRAHGCVVEECAAGA